MNTTEFNRLLQVARNGGREVVGEEASALQDLLRKMVAGFLKRQNVLPDSSLVDDLVGALFILLLKLKRIPERYSWNSWFWYAVKTVWAEYCRTTYSQAVFDEYEKQAPLLSVPVEANARMLEGKLRDLLYQRMMKRGPVISPDRDVWGWAVAMLLDYGQIQNEKNAAVRAGMDLEECRRLIMRAVVKTRMLWEELFEREEEYTIEECGEARKLADRIF